MSFSAQAKTNPRQRNLAFSAISCLTSGRPTVTFGVGEVGAIVGEHRVDCLGNGIDRTAEEVASIPSDDPFMQLGEGELAGAIDSHVHVELALLNPHLGDIPYGVCSQTPIEQRIWK